MELDRGDAGAGAAANAIVDAAGRQDAAAYNATTARMLPRAASTDY